MLISLLEYVGEKYRTSPLLKVKDKALDLHVLTSATSRGAILKCMSSMRDGSQFDEATQQPTPDLNLVYAKIKSFRLEPINPEPNMTFVIGGELLEAQRMQGRILDEALKTFP